MNDDANRQERTAALMRATAEELEQEEAILHHSAEVARDEAKKERLHRLGDEVTAMARNITRRADLMSDGARHATGSRPAGRTDHPPTGMRDKRPAP